MDSWVKDKLMQWGLERYERVFEEQEVYRMAFECLRDDSVKAMIPLAGPQAKFFNQWNVEFGNPCFVNSVGSVESVIKPTALPLDIAPVTFPFSEVGISEMAKSHPTTAEVNVVMLQATNNPGFSSSTNGNRFWWIDSADITLRPCNPITDLVETLKDSVEGVAILHYYRKHRDLEDEHRNFLVDIIISAEMRSSPSLS